MTVFCNITADSVVTWHSYYSQHTVAMSLLRTECQGSSVSNLPLNLNLKICTGTSTAFTRGIFNFSSYSYSSNTSREPNPLSQNPMYFT